MRSLIVDIGAGTMDILCCDMDSGEHFKAVAKSPVRTLAEVAARSTGDLLISGVEMGGGPLSEVLKERAKSAEVIMSGSAAATIHHDPDRVRSWGIKVLENVEVEALVQDGRYTHLTTADLDVARIREILHGLGVSFSFDVVGLCAQDHGVPPKGVSHLDYRHNLFKATLEGQPYPHAVLYRKDEVPETFSRLKALAESAGALSAEEIYVMDSGMAAILGATMDPGAKEQERVLVLDVATSHTVGAALEGEEIAGFFEYHTRDITLERLEGLLVDLAEGNLSHSQILEEGGHGAYVRKTLGFENIELIIATGPKRGLVQNSHLAMVQGAPLGDNMMTGTAGVLEAIGRRKGLKPWSSAKADKKIL